MPSSHMTEIFACWLFSVTSQWFLICTHKAFLTQNQPSLPKKHKSQLCIQNCFIKCCYTVSPPVTGFSSILYCSMSLNPHPLFNNNMHFYHQGFNHKHYQHSCLLWHPGCLLWLTDHQEQWSKRSTFRHGCAVAGGTIQKQQHERKTINISGSCIELNHNFRSTTPKRVKPDKLAHIYLCTWPVYSIL